MKRIFYLLNDQIKILQTIIHKSKPFIYNIHKNTTPTEKPPFHATSLDRHRPDTRR